MEFPQESLDYVLPLAAHMVVADQQVHDRELAIIEALACRPGVSRGAQLYAQAILAAADDAQPFADALRAVPPQHRETALRALAAVALADGVIVSAERTLLDRAAQLWRVPTETVDLYTEEARRYVMVDAQSSEATSPTLAARVVARVDALLGAQAIDTIGGLVGAKERVQSLRREFLLSGPEYDHAIEACAAIARVDLVRCDAELRGSMQALDHVLRELRRHSDALSSHAARDNAASAREASGLIRTTAVHLESELRCRLEHLRAGLLARERTVGSFTIAFMGRTKAGKTTLHAVLSGEGHEAIGTGKQRTTRFNRVYHWKHVRVIDTPGIGAPGGASDVEIAESIVDEADLVCYVVTNDSQQATELDFLSKLRARAKPVVILLNVKGNLRHPKRLDRYLANPDRELEDAGTRGVPGHVQRIRRYVEERIGGVGIEVVPVHLLAAQMAAEPAHQARSKQLRAASRLGAFLDRLRVSIIDHGTLRRSQTLLGCSAADLHQVAAWLEGRGHELGRSIESVRAQRSEVARQLDRAAVDSRKRLEVGIAGAYTRVRPAVGRFAEENWAATQTSLDVAWRKELDELGLEPALVEAQNVALSEYQTRIHEVLEEAGRELEALAAIDAGRGRAPAQETGALMHDILKWVSRAAILAGAVVGLFVTGPVGWAIGALAVAAGLLKLLFRSSAERRAEAVQRIRDALGGSLEEASAAALARSRQAFDEMTVGTATSVLAYFDTVLRELEGARRSIGDGAYIVRSAAGRLDIAFAQRVVNWAAGPSRAAPSVVQVVRHPGAEMVVHVDGPVPRSGREAELGQLLLERVRFVVDRQEVKAQ